MHSPEFLKLVKGIPLKWKENLFEDQEDFIEWAKDRLPIAFCSTSLQSNCVSLSLFISGKRSQKFSNLLLDFVRIVYDNQQLVSFEINSTFLEKFYGQTFLIAKFHFLTKSQNEIEKGVPLFLELLKLSYKWPEEFNHDFVQDYHSFLAVSEKEFRLHRCKRHQFRLLVHLQLMRKELLRLYPQTSHQLQLKMRLLPTSLKYSFSEKSVMGVAIAVALTNSYDRLEDHHILLAVQKLIPCARAIKESYLVFHKPHSALRFLYLEIEKNPENSFSLNEKLILKQNLEKELKNCVETLNPSVFGRCDVEEIMRNIFSLSEELKSDQDLPQVMISFEGSSANKLIFRVIVVRLLRRRSKSLLAYFQALNDESFEYVPERCSEIGYIGKRTKEATVFRLHLTKDHRLLRSDQSLNLYRARYHIYSLIARAIGEIRDFNGGIFSKQLENYSEFRNHFRQYDPELLEDFFHAINPPEMQVILPLASISILFNLFFQALVGELPRNESYNLVYQKQEDLLFTILRIKDLSFEERLTRELTKSKFFQDIKSWMILRRHDGLVLGYILQSSAEKQQFFSEFLNQILSEWLLERQTDQIFRIDIQDFPVSLDPRLGGDDISGILLQFLFDGLMHRDEQGALTYAIAQNVQISDEGKYFTFTLRECHWNNGDRVTADDFCYAWKKILSPDFSTPFAYLFYVIKNARLAKAGQVPLDHVGISAINKNTLVVELEYPCSYFLELTASALFSPVNHLVDQVRPNWFVQKGQDYVSNGPFCLESTTAQEIYILQKNPRYWNRSRISLTRIQISKATARMAKEMFQNKEIDWLGRPSRPWEPLFSSTPKHPPKTLPLSSVCWCCCNVQQFPLHSSKIRLALAYCLDRQAIANQLSEGRTPAFSPLPYIHVQQQRPHDWNRERALSLFEEGLQELGIHRKEWPVLKLIYANNEIRREIAANIVKQWREVLGIKVHIEGCEFRDLFTQMSQGQYQLGLMMWRAWVDDPLYTFNAFNFAADEINFPKWEHPSYQKIIERAIQETDLKTKKEHFRSAETLLIEEMPVIPIIYESELYMKAEGIKGEAISKVGNIDFRYVSKDEKSTIVKSL